MGGKSGGNEAAQARKDEQERQARIRQGTSRINGIFDGTGPGKDPISAGTAYDPTRSYYKADGSLWSPTTGVNEAYAGREFSQAAGSGQLFGDLQRTGGFNDAFFDGRRKAYIDYAQPQLQDQYGKANEELTFALARGGNLDSSVRGEKASELQKKFDLGAQEIADKGLSYSTQTRNSVEDARSSLISQLNATGDAQGAASAAMARASALSQPQAFSPVTDLFANFTAGLGQQAALERASFYSGGMTPGPKYNTGLFAPSSNAVKVT